jgi:hypothetical protein
MRHHEFTIELPDSTPRLSALFQGCHLRKKHAPGMLDVGIIYPGGAQGNGLLGKVIHPPPLGRRNESFEIGKSASLARRS